MPGRAGKALEVPAIPGRNLRPVVTPITNRVAVGPSGALGSEALYSLAPAGATVR